MCWLIRAGRNGDVDLDKLLPTLAFIDRGRRRRKQNLQSAGLNGADICSSAQLPVLASHDNLRGPYALEMRKHVYEQLAQMLCVPFNAWPHCNLLAKNFDTSVETVVSIYMQQVTLRVKRNHHLLKEAIPSYARRFAASLRYIRPAPTVYRIHSAVRRYCDGSDMLSLWAEADIAPCMFLRRLLEQPPWSCNKQARTKILKSPAAIWELFLWQDAEGCISQQMLLRLEADVQHCIDCDQVYSPDADAKRLQIGIDHEELLNETLADAKIAFWTEEHLRDRGFFKTPDAMLQVPIAVKGQLVHWIDSKATFGDSKSHAEQMQEQFSKYINRYGPGMVIYWFGFVDELQDMASDLILADGFPAATDIMQLPSLPLPEETLTNSG